MRTWSLVSVVLGLIVTIASASHFRGAIFTWMPGVNQNEIIVDYRISWRLTTGENYYCNDSIIQSGQTVLGGGSLTCFSGCTGNVGALHFQCTDYSTVEDWTSGKGRLTYTANTNVFELGFASSAWIASLNVAHGYGWMLRVKVDLNVRRDTGRINSSPVAEIAPIIRFQYGCTYTIQIPVQDPDHDFVRCRWAVNNANNGDECAGVCNAFPHAYLDEDACTLTYTAQYATGWYAIALQIEDFAHSTDRTPLSSIPMQFLAHITNETGACASKPEFIDPTPQNGECVVVRPYDVFNRTIIISSNSSISELKTVSPLGMTKSPLTKLNSTTWMTTVTWSPTSINTTSNVFCFTAVNTDGQRSEKRCITLLAGVQRPILTPVIDQHNGLVDPTQTTWSVAVDIPFSRGTNHSYIELYSGNGSLVEKIDAADPYHVHLYPNNRTFTFDTSTVLDVNQTYYFKFDAGVVKSSAFCGAESYPIQSPKIWTFYIDSVPVRLVNGTDAYSGRVEVFYNGQWGSICDDWFDKRDAEVVCRMLGMYNVDGDYKVYDRAYFGESTGPILLDDVRCQGSESNIAECPSHPWYHNDCHNYEDVGVSCYAETQVRLMNGTTRYEGRVEVYHNGTWGSVCDDGFDQDAAIVICKMLGFYSGYSDVVAYSSAHFGQGNGGIALDDLRCNGTENNIDECRTKPWFNSDCSHAENAGIDCRSKTGIRLVNGPTRYSGRVEINRNGTWGSVCDDYLNTEAVRVFCKMLGMYIGDSYGVGYSRAYFGQGTGPIALDVYNCYGNETDINQCVTTPSWTHNSCNHNEDIGIDCHGNIHGPTLPQTIPTTRPTTPYTMSTPYRTSTYRAISTTGPYTAPTSVYPTTPPPTTTDYSTSSGITPVRLVGGWSPQSGRVEVYHLGSWGTICDDNLDITAAIVLCKMLGYYRGDRYVQAFQGGTLFPAGSGQIALDNLRCTGYETDITECMSTPWYQNDCTHGEDAGIDCWSGLGSTQMFTTPPASTYVYPTTSGYRLEDAITVRCTENGWDIVIDMHKLRLVYPGAVASDIYLGENTCTGSSSWNTLSFQHGLHECLTEKLIRNNNLVYRNELLYAERDPVHPFIVKHFNWTVAVECDLQRNETSSGYIHHDNGQQPIVGSSHYSVNMSFYSDPNYMNPISGNPVHVTYGSDVYVKVYTEAPDWSVKMKVTDCYTRPTPTSPDNLKYDLISNGCEMDSNTHIISQSTHETRFMFQDFAYTSHHNGVYVYCDAIFCRNDDYSSSCTQACNP